MARSKDNSLTDGLSQIASVLKSNGIDGELIMGFRDFDPDNINLTEPVFIIFDGLLVPFFIESFVKRGYSKALVHLTDILTYEDAEELVGKAVWRKSKETGEMSLEDSGFEALVGWTLLTPSQEEEFDEEEDEIVNAETGEELLTEEYTSGEEEFDEEEESDCEEEMIEEMDFVEVGTIIEFYDIPGNPCIEVETKNGAVMIPLHEDFILSIDPEYKEIVMDIPNGLI